MIVDRREQWQLKLLEVLVYLELHGRKQFGIAEAMQFGIGGLKVLIIGANGFIGRHLGRRLKEIPGAQVSGTFSFHTPMTQDHPWYPMELTDEQRSEQVFSLVKPDVVVHLAAIADVKEAEKNPERVTAVNVGGTSLIAHLC